MGAEKRVRSSDAIDAYLARFAGKSSRATYANALRNFQEWCAAHDVDLLDVKAWHFDLYVVEVAQTRQPSTVHHMQGVISRFYGYLVGRNELPSSPVPDGWRPPRPYRVNPEKAVPASTLAAIDKAATELGGIEFAVTRLVTETGLLPEAISKIDVADLSLGSGSAVLTIRQTHGAGIPSRRLSPELAEALKELVQDRSEGPLLVNHYGNVLSRANVARLLDKVAKSAGVPRITATALRQSAVQALAQSGLSGKQLEALYGIRAGRLKGVSEGVSEDTPAAFALQLLALSEVLLDEPGTEPAASVVLTGAGLEYYLKRMAAAAGVSPSPSGGIAAAASALRSTGAISKQERKSIEVWGGLRNHAVHGEFAEVADLDARQLNESFKAFVSRHPLE